MDHSLTIEALYVSMKESRFFTISKSLLCFGLYVSTEQKGHSFAVIAKCIYLDRRD